METFPVQYSTLSATALGDKISKDYDLAVQYCKFLLHGVSDTYVVTAEQGKFIFKVYRDKHRSPEEIRGEIELLDILFAAGAKVAPALPAADGRKLVELQAPEGLRHGALFSFTQGRALEAFDATQLETIGREMAFNHNIAAVTALQWPRKAYDEASTVQRPLRLLKPAFEAYPEGYAMLQHTAGLVRAKLAAYDTEQFSMGYCHYDYFPHNFFFDEANRMTLFDFAGRGYLAYDLASIFVHFFFDTQYKQKPPATAQAEFDQLVAGYRQLRAISAAELEAVPLLGYQLLLFYLGYRYEHFDDWSNSFFGLRYLKARVGVMEKLATIHCGITL